MYCTNCGAANDANDETCRQCGRELPDVSALEKSGITVAVDIPNYLFQAVLVSFCCCIPFGIPAIVYAAQVNGAIERGDLAAAERNSKRDECWCWIAFGTGIIVSIFQVFLQTWVELTSLSD